MKGYLHTISSRMNPNFRCNPYVLQKVDKTVRDSGRSIIKIRDFLKVSEGQCTSEITVTASWGCII